VALADVLVQPGADNDFNAYRIPGKLPEFFATGRPVVLPKSNVGLKIADGEQGILLNEPGAQELVRVLGWLLTNRPAREGIGRLGRQFAVENFSCVRGTDRLLALYQEACACFMRCRTSKTNLLMALLSHADENLAQRDADLAARAAEIERRDEELARLQ